MHIDDTLKSSLLAFSKIIGVEFKEADFPVLREALTHKSFTNEQKPTPVTHNERLEFLGDAVLELAITEYLYQKYPTRPEGDLTSFRAALVRKESIGAAATRLQIGEHMLMSKGEEQTGGRSREYILANAFEAVIGAIYLTSGYKPAADFAVNNLTAQLNEIVKNRLDIDAKSKLQEIVQEKLRFTPSYKLMGETGPDHNKQFTMGLEIDGKIVSEGSGHSKQEAEQAAASAALENWDQLYSNYANSAKIAPD